MLNAYAENLLSQYSVYILREVLHAGKGYPYVDDDASDKTGSSNIQVGP